MSKNKSEKNTHKEKKFLNLPKYPGGSKAFKRFIHDNMIYPEEALTNKIEGDVYVKFRVNNLGNVIEAEVTRGIGYGCDDEALRLVKLLKYEEARNRGVRVASTIRTRIRFKLPYSKQSQGFKFSYNMTVSKTTDSKQEEKPLKNRVYQYSVKIKNKSNH